MKARAAALAAATVTLGPAVHTERHRPGCPRLFSVRMGERAARAIYRPRHRVTLRNLRLLGYVERCQRNPAAQGFVRWFDHSRSRLWKAARASLTAPWNGPVVASWYDDGGTTACGFHASYGFASLILPCGARVQIRGPGGTVTATMQDHGPYVAGRTFDLNPALKAALGCSDLCDVTWRPA